MCKIKAFMLQLVQWEPTQFQQQVQLRFAFLDAV